MYKLTYKGQFVEGFDEDQVVGNLAQLLNLKPKVVRLALLSNRHGVIKILDSASEAERWCAAFQDAGVYLDVVSVDSQNAEAIADQTELELELHELDPYEDEEPDERNYLIRKLPESTSPKNDNQAATVTEPQVAVAKESTAVKVASVLKDIPDIHELSVAKIDALTKQLLEEAKNAVLDEPGVQEPVPDSENMQAETAAVKVNVISESEKIEIKTETTKAAVKPKAGKTKTAKIDAASVTASPDSPDKKPASAKNQESTKKSTTTKKVPVKKSADKAAPTKQLAEKPLVTTQQKHTESEVVQPDTNAVLKAPIQSPVQPPTPPVPPIQQDLPLASDNLLPVTRKEHTGAETIPVSNTTDGKQGGEKRPSLVLVEDVDENVHEELNFHKSYFVWGMLTILLAIIATAAAIFWLKKSNWTPVDVAPQEAKITEAIGFSSLFGLIHLDVSRLQFLSPSNNVLTQFPGPEANFWKNITGSGIDPNQQVDDAWLAVYEQDNLHKILWVLEGNFPVDKWRDAFKKNYLIDGDTPDGIIFSKINDSNCEKNVFSASIGKTRIVIGVPELVATFNGRLQAGAASEKNLETWSNVYKTQMASAVLFHPAQLSERSAASALWKLSIPAEPVQGVYLGLEPKMFPPGVEFNARILSEDKPFLEDTEKKLAAAASAAKTTLVMDWPETLSLYEHLKISQDVNQVSARLNLDENAPQQIQILLASLASKAFALEAPASEFTEEQLDTSPAFVSLPSGDLPAYTVKNFNESFIAQTSSGPFGIGVSDIEKTEQGVEINMDVKAFNLPNLSKENDSVFLQITDIVDHQDQSILTNRACGSEQSTPINSVYQGTVMENDQPVTFTGLQGMKNIVLPAGIDLPNVGAVKGVIHHQLPLAIERVKIDGPLAGKTLEVQGIKFRFFNADSNRLYFQMSGNTDALLQVNALNEAGNALAKINTVRGNSFFDQNKMSVDFQGKIAAAEIVVATQFEQKNYEFSIARLFPPAKPFVQEKPEPVYLKKVNLPALEKDTPPNDVAYPTQPAQIITAGPAVIAVNELRISDNKLSLTADIYTRNSHPLADQLGTVSLIITEIEDSSGNLHTVNQRTPVAFEADTNRPWLRAVLEIRDRPIEHSDAIAFWGKLVFTAMEDPVPIKVPFQFGMQWNANEGVLKLRRWEEGHLIFDVEGSFPELMAVRALDEKGLLVSQPAELRTSSGKNTIELDVKQIPETIEFNISRTKNSTEFPLEIRVQ